MALCTQPGARDLERAVAQLEQDADLNGPVFTEALVLQQMNWLQVLPIFLTH